MYRLPSIILRYGVILGLVLTLTGTIVKELVGIRVLVTVGLLTIIVTPITSLLIISLYLMFKRELYMFTLSILAILVILTSIVIFLYTGYSG